MGFMDWFNAKEAEFNTAYKAKYGVNAPVGNAADQPGDKLAKAEAVTEALRRKGGPSWQEALLTGANSTMRIGDKAATGGVTGLVGSVTGLDSGVTEEQMRKHNAAVHELSPGLHTAGMIGGALLSAPAAAITWGRGALGYGAKPVVGPMQAVATKAPSTGIGPAVVAEAARPYTAGAFSRALTDAVARGSNAGAMSKAVAAANASTAAIVGGLGAYGLGVGEYDQSATQAPAKPKVDKDGKYVPEEGMPSDPRFANFRYDADPAVAAKQKEVLLAIKGMEDRSRGLTSLNRDLAQGGDMSVATQYWEQIHNWDGSLKPGITPKMEARARLAADYDAKSKAMGDGTRVAVPEDAFPGGEMGAAIWQNQFGQADKLTAANNGVPVPLAAVMDDPDLVAFANRSAEDDMHLKLGLQAGITDPKLAIAASKSGAITNDMLARSGELQLSRTTPRTTFKDELVAQEMADIEVAAKAAEAEKDPEKQKQLKAAVAAARQRLLRWSLLGKEGLEDLMDTAKPNQ